MIWIGILLISLGAIGFILGMFYLFPFIWGAPFEPSHKKQLMKMIEFADIKKGDKIAELGSGDGRVVIALAKRGALAHGFEINPFLVWYSKKKIKKEKLEDKAFIHWKSFWKEDLGKYNVVVLFQFKTIMKKLERKLNKELKSGTKIVSNEWKFSGWKSVKKSKRVYLYNK